MNYLSRFLNWIRSAPNRREINLLNNLLAQALRERDIAETYWREVEVELRDLEFAENNARAQLMQLRVSQCDVRGRTGYSVCAFIPTEVVETVRLKMPDAVDNFTNVIAHELVRRAMQGAFHVNSRGKVSALIFGRGKSGHYEPCGVLFDSDKRPQLATGVAPQPEPGPLLDAGEEISQRRQLNYGY